ncbi:DivIVA domain-containing protein [Hugenholtzia roseola]|uniref:DivIVA domain-containing protein n=1 Tax=Hugenholtzia roseola TaxID=1002 RepID=UPI000408AD4F|nr:DivIVA domain-containing protein [Hugenholtzia roseola]
MQTVTIAKIKEHTFKKATFGGYRKEEVSEFLANLAEDWQQLHSRNEILEDQIAQARAELQKLKEIEAALLQNLQQTQSASKLTLEQAEKQAQVKLMEAQVRADSLLHQAKEKADALLAQAAQKAEKLITEAKNFSEQTLTETNKELNRLQYAHEFTVQQRQKMLEDLTEFLENSLKKVKRFAEINVENTVPHFQGKVFQMAQKEQLNLQPTSHSASQPAAKPLVDFAQYKEQQKNETAKVDRKNNSEEVANQPLSKEKAPAKSQASEEKAKGLLWDFDDLSF